jgi:hypothetical protein
MYKWHYKQSAAAETMNKKKHSGAASKIACFGHAHALTKHLSKPQH